LGFGAIAAAVVTAAGIWQGTLERDGAGLEVEVQVTEGAEGLQGRFSSAQLRAIGVPLSAVRAEADSVTWQLVGDRTTMTVDAMVRGDSLTGTFKDGPDSGVIRLRRVAVSRFAAREEEIAFAGEGGALLSGTILRPVGDGPFPGVVFLHGSGPEGRWGSRYLAHEFVRGGFAALIYDKRGVGASKGDWRTAGFEELVGDASAAVAALAARPGITRVGIFGHSQGGTIAPWVAVKNANVAFVIASAASGVTMAEAEIYSLDNTVRARGVPAEDEALAKRFVRELVEVAYAGKAPTVLDEIRHAAEGRPWLFPVPAPSAPYWAFSRRISGYDPLHWWGQVRVPVLLAYGAADERVPVQPSISRITSVLQPQGMYTLKVFPQADHAFRVKKPSGKFSWPESVAGYPDSIVDWARRIVADR
jgi:pimeloyl-ACP methyl ester carboxylesterase